MIESWNHLSWKGPLKIIWFISPAVNRGAYGWIGVLRALSSLALNVSRDGESTTSLSNQLAIQ